MKERPILFSGHMVRAILNGQKTVTRREIKPSMRSADSSFELHQQEDESWRPMHTFDESCMDAKGTEHPIVCPYGQPGDRLWVREAWLADAQLDSIAPRDLSQGEPILYPADGSVRQTGCAMVSQGRGRPSIHMPRWASRILLEITAVRVERLQAITWEEALDEGIGDHRFECDRPVEPDGYPACSCGSVGYVDAFAELWNTINGAGAWESNPWVWVVEFKRVEP